MRQYGYLYNNFQGMQDFVSNMSITNDDKILIQIFTGIIESEFIRRIIYEITSLLPQAEIIGATTSGEIFEGEVFNNNTILSFSVFENTELKSKLFNEYVDEEELIVAIADEMVEEDTKLLILFAEGLITKSEKIIKNIYKKNPKVVICGGKAGDNGFLNKTFIFTKSEISQRGIAAVALKGESLKVIREYSFCWSTIGKVMTITNAVDNRIFTIDNMKTIDIYKKYLGDEIYKELPISATEFPLVLKGKGIDVARIAYECHEDGSMSFLGNFQIGDEVQFGYGNVSMITENSLKIVNGLQDKPIEGIFIYSCIVRRVFMQNSSKLETLPLNNIAPTYGFFTYGEFFTTDNSCELMNVTMTIVGISEGGKNIRKNNCVKEDKVASTKNIFYGKELGVIKAFTHLSNQVAKELKEANELLEYQKQKIEQTQNISNLIMEINNEMLHLGGNLNLLQTILDKTIDLIPNAKIGSILLKQDNKLVYKATKGYLLDKINKMNYSIESVEGCNFFDKYLLSELEPKIIKNLEQNLFSSKEIYNSWAEMFEEVPKVLLSCGIVVDGEVLGMVNIFNTDNETKFLEEVKPLIKHLCNEIAMTLKNAKLLEKILYMSRYDSLTGVYNRSYFREMLDKVLDKATTEHSYFSVCALDLNNLKIVNDAYGHDVGDRFLIRFVEIFTKKLDKSDVFGRTGGDEFTVIFNNKNMAQVKELLEDICNAFKGEIFDYDGNRREISFAYGISEFPSDSRSINKLLRIADQRMYEKKKKMKESF